MDFLATTLSIIATTAQNVSPVIPIVIAIAEAITRLTPTEKDDGFVERIGSGIRKVLDIFHVPNNKKRK